LGRVNVPVPVFIETGSGMIETAGDWPNTARQAKRAGAASNFFINGIEIVRLLKAFKVIEICAILREK
jgi:hypothetical protein